MTKKDFNKQEFCAFFATEYSLSQKQGAELFDKIGNGIREALESGGSVRLFGIGTLKLVKRRGTDEVRIRFRPAGFRNQSAAGLTLIADVDDVEDEGAEG